MLALQYIRDHPEEVRRGAQLKGYDCPIDQILELDRSRRSLLIQSEALRAERNAASSRSRGSPTPQMAAAMRSVAERIKALEAETRQIDTQLDRLLLEVPNPAHETVPVGPDASGNIVLRERGSKPDFGFAPRPHYEIGEIHDILDFSRAAKVAGSRFAFVKGWGARLERALVQFMLDLHTLEHGYREVFPPLLVNRRAMVGTANLPKFADEVFSVAEADFFLIPTAEVPLTNLHADEILDESSLPLRYVAYSPCFRSEAGAAGQDTRGYIRLHQFQKVELVVLSPPDQSMSQLELLTSHAEEVLLRLEIPYRVLAMCTGDLGFAQWKKYDIEAWAPGLGRYLEVSSCSNFGAFQARRANLRFRAKASGKVAHLHTLNGSGLASARTFDAILENYQRADGSVMVPSALRPYLGGIEVLGAQP